MEEEEEEEEEVIIKRWLEETTLRYIRI